MNKYKRITDKYPSSRLILFLNKCKSHEKCPLLFVMAGQWFNKQKKLDFDDTSLIIHLHSTPISPLWKGNDGHLAFNTQTVGSFLLLEEQNTHS